MRHLVAALLATAAAGPALAETAVGLTSDKTLVMRMYDIDATISALVKQAPPNDGTLAAVGKLGVTLDGPVGFDVATTAEGANTAWLAALGGLHTVDLETGAVTGTTAITGTDQPLRDLAVLPAM